MIYSKADVDFAQITPNDFERLCRELLIKTGYSAVIWRQGGADQGRDIEGYYNFHNQITNQQTKWYFECKHYTNGVPPEELHSKIAWADAGRPDYLVFFISSYLTTGARTWLDGIRQNKSYKIITIEGEELKEKIVQFPEIVETFFSSNSTEKFFKEIKHQNITYGINPSYEVLSRLFEKLDPKKLDINDLGFLLISFFKQYDFLKLREDYFGDFTESIISPVIDRLQELSTKNSLESFEPYKNNYTILDNNGFINAAYYEDDTIVAHEYELLHLNYKNEDHRTWALGEYLLFQSPDGRVFEIFSLNDSDFSTSSRFLDPFDINNMSQLSISVAQETQNWVKAHALRYIKSVQDSQSVAS